jgi:hypothetical protein
MHAMDWRGSDAHPGLGALLMLRAFATSETQYAIGGSEQGQAVFPRLGFEQKPKLAIFRKVLAPIHRLRTKGPEAVELRSAPTFTEEIDCLQRPPSLRMVTCRRDHVLLNYLLRCPLSVFSGWTIHTSQRMIGFALLKIAPHGRIQLGKIVDCWLDTEDPSYWQAAVAALIDHLSAISVNHVTCYATTPSLHAALLWNGFAKSGEINVCVRDKQQALPRDIPFGLSTPI